MREVVITVPAESRRGESDRSLALFGHSMGATVAFEVASRLEAIEVMPLALFVSGRRPTSRHRDETVHQRTDDGIMAELKALNGTELALLGDEELVRMILPTIRSDYRAIETYRYQPKPKLNCPIIAFAGDSDPRVDVAEMLGWPTTPRRRSTCTVLVLPVSGRAIASPGDVLLEPACSL